MRSRNPTTQGIGVSGRRTGAATGRSAGGPSERRQRVRRDGVPALGRCWLVGAHDATGFTAAPASCRLQPATRWVPRSRLPWFRGPCGISSNPVLKSRSARLETFAPSRHRIGVEMQRRLTNSPPGTLTNLLIVATVKSGCPRPIIGVAEWGPSSPDVVVVLRVSGPLDEH